MNNIRNTDLEQRSYIFSINAISFVKSMQKAGLQNDKTILLLQISSDFYTKMMDIIDLEENDSVIGSISECIKLLEKCHQLIMDTRCNDDKLLLKEKADLQIETTFLIKDLTALKGVD